MKYLSVLFLFFYSTFSFAQSPKIIDYTARVNFGFRHMSNRKIDVVVIHSTYYVGKDTFSVAGVLSQFRRYNVASHYLIDRKGNIYRLVPEADEAYHAGKSILPANRRVNLNATSIGIELINTPSTPPDNRQYKALVTLIKNIKQRYPIHYIVGHSDIAPKRKTDPWNFNWKKFRQMMEE
ncbi:N-acetylmuramoyl-L-alanine amidase [Microbacter margulisiae]|uniref:N-acetylmuramoyl-L-alanine amidase n=1 Tax=Microbacter margulisiae TaxID=1350067 RepID=A0A7W5DT47_9PORP|nr:N-acetylmuramoyl-L-alanine amidase [Microbacter margulisiae]MBB3188579.1 N-acetyl-anhydromuramyl-L-alanine amidase AmpD [Microbacter margulisiae]